MSANEGKVLTMCQNVRENGGTVTQLAPCLMPLVEEMLLYVTSYTIAQNLA